MVEMSVVVSAKEKNKIPVCRAKFKLVTSLTLCTAVHFQPLKMVKKISENEKAKIVLTFFLCVPLKIVKRC